MNRLKKLGIKACLLLLSGLWSSGLAQVQVTRTTVDAGGVVFSQSGGIELSGTIGQPDAGLMTGPGISLSGGFWFSLAPGDCNADGLLNLADHSDVVGCMEGPGAPAAPIACACLDLDGSGDVDLRDVRLFMNGFEGSH